MNEELTRKLERRRASQRADAVANVRSEHRKLAAWFALQWLFAIAAVLAFRSPAPLFDAVEPRLAAGALAAVSMMFALAGLGAGVRVARALGSRATLLWAIVLFVPGLNLLGFAALSMLVSEHLRKGAAA